MLKTLVYKARLVLALLILVPVLLIVFLAWLAQKLEHGLNLILRGAARPLIAFHDVVAPPKHKGVGWHA